MRAGLDEMVRPRTGTAEELRSHWKVTARFSLQVGEGQSVRCVRVRMGCGPSLHYTEEEFERLFESVEGR